MLAVIGGRMTGKRRARAGSIERLMEVDNERSEMHEREPDTGKITLSEIHRHMLIRVDDHIEVRILAATKRDLPHKVWLVFLALQLGIVEDARGVLRFHPACREEKPRTPRDREVARYYRLAASTVAQYDRRALRVYRAHRDQAAGFEDWE